MEYVNNRKRSIYRKGAGEVKPGETFTSSDKITMRGVDEVQKAAKAAKKEQGADPE